MLKKKKKSDNFAFLISSCLINSKRMTFLTLTVPSNSTSYFSFCAPETSLLLSVKLTVFYASVPPSSKPPLKHRDLAPSTDHWLRLVKYRIPTYFWISDEEYFYKCVPSIAWGILTQEVIGCLCEI